MSRQFGMSRRAVGGIDQPSGSHAQGDPRDLDSLLLSTYTPFPRGQLAQAMFDVLTLCVWVLLGMIGVAILGGPILVIGWMLFFS